MINDTIFYILFISYFFSITQILQYILKADFHFVSSQVYEQFCVPLILLITILGFSYLDISGYKPYLNVYGSLYILVSAILVLLVYKKIKVKYKPKRKEYLISTWMKNSVSVGVGLFLSLILSRIDILCLGFYGSANEVGGYGIAVRFACLIIIPGAAVAHLLDPHIITISADKVKLKKFFSYASLGTVMINIFCLIFFLLVKNIVFNFMGKDYSAYSSLFVIIGLGQIFNLLNGIYFTFCCAQNKQGALSKIMIIDGIILIILYKILYDGYGVMGMAITSMVNTIVLNVFVGKLIINKK